MLGLDLMSLAMSSMLNDNATFFSGALIKFYVVIKIGSSHDTIKSRKKVVNNFDTLNFIEPKFIVLNSVN